MSLLTSYRQRPTSNRPFNSGRLIIGLIIAAISVFSYFGSREFNPITNEKQYISLTPHQEIALGLQAVPEMMGQFGGLDPDHNAQRKVDLIGQHIVEASSGQGPAWEFDFHLLSDSKTVNAFALPGGQVFITRALFDDLRTDGQLAGVLAHEVVHVLARHSAQHIAKQQLTQGLTGAVMTASGDADAGRLAAMIGQMVNMKYGRNDELQSDHLGVEFMSAAGYDPRAMIEVMRVLEKSGGGGNTAEFFSTHPNPENRIQKIEDAIRTKYPEGVPPGLMQ